MRMIASFSDVEVPDLHVLQFGSHEADNDPMETSAFFLNLLLFFLLIKSTSKLVSRFLFFWPKY